MERYDIVLSGLVSRHAGVENSLCESLEHDIGHRQGGDSSVCQLALAFFGVRNTDVGTQ